MLAVAAEDSMGTPGAFPASIVLRDTGVSIAVMDGFAAALLDAFATSSSKTGASGTTFAACPAAAGAEGASCAFEGVDATGAVGADFVTGTSSSKAGIFAFGFFATTSAVAVTDLAGEESTASFSAVTVLGVRSMNSGAPAAFAGALTVVVADVDVDVDVDADADEADAAALSAAALGTCGVSSTKAGVAGAAGAGLEASVVSFFGVVVVCGASSRNSGTACAFLAIDCSLAAAPAAPAVVAVPTAPDAAEAGVFTLLPATSGVTDANSTNCGVAAAAGFATDSTVWVNVFVASVTVAAAAAAVVVSGAAGANGFTAIALSTVASGIFEVSSTNAGVSGSGFVGSTAVVALLVSMADTGSITALAISRRLEFAM
jgi:hypothetical protein